LPADKPNDHSASDAAGPPVKKATLGQIASTMFWAMCMIGKKGTWERDGAKISLPQAVVGAVIAGVIVVGILILLARFATR
jgi:hypothetical protein